MVASQTTGTSANIWKPKAQFPVGTPVELQRGLGERVLNVVTPVKLDPINKWILVWPTDPSEEKFTERLQFKIAAI